MHRPNPLVIPVDSTSSISGMCLLLGSSTAIALSQATTGASPFSCLLSLISHLCSLEIALQLGNGVRGSCAEGEATADTLVSAEVHFPCVLIDTLSSSWLAMCCSSFLFSLSVKSSGHLCGGMKIRMASSPKIITKLLLKYSFKSPFPAFFFPHSPLPVKNNKTNL